MTSRNPVDADFELVGGSWQPDRAVLRWVADHEAPEQRNDVHLLIACPTCRAAIHERCRTRDGNSRPPHSTRIVPRRCLCGDVIPNRRAQKWCTACKVAARRAQGRQADSKRVELKREYDRARRTVA